MAEGLVQLIPEAEVWHIGLYRDEATLLPTEYYNKFPPRPRVTLSAFLVDPMLATGGSAVRACEILKSAGVPRMKLLTLIVAGGDRQAQPGDARRAHSRGRGRRAAQRGRIHSSCPGDAGDRQFATGGSERLTILDIIRPRSPNPDPRTPNANDESRRHHPEEAGRPGLEAAEIAAMVRGIATGEVADYQWRRC